MLKQIKPEDRIIFLKKFAAELVMNSGKPKLIEMKIKKQIEEEKLRQKFLKPIESEKGFEGFQKSISFFPQPTYPKKPQVIVEEKPEIKEIRKLIKRKPLFHRARATKQIPVQKMRRFAFFPSRQIKPQLVQPQQITPPVQPVAQPRPEGLSLGRLESLLKDPSIQSIECPGPGRNILIKRHNKINATRITLTQPEITNTIDNFAQQARIPIIGGILKAAVGDLVISAVISEFIGSRFIISKISPYNLIQG